MQSALLRIILAVMLTSTTATTALAARPKLGVLLVFDQLPAWLFERYAPFWNGAFGGLNGAHYDAIYNYAATETGPGHATLSTCTNPSEHGISINTWFHDGKKLYAVDDPAFPSFMGNGGRADYGRSSRMLLQNTLGDAMKTDSDGRAKVVALSHKDRSAVLTGGHAADLAVWYDPGQGRYTTSSAYKKAMPPWLEDLGLALPTKTMAEATWSPLAIPRGLEALVPKDERAGESHLAGFDATFPHDLSTIDEKLKKSAYRFVPQSIGDLFTLALRAVDEEGLGKDAEPDLLVISVSTTDVVGHNYGGHSLEQLDTLRRADGEVRRFVAALAARVGSDNLVVGLSSDHGAPDLPAGIAASGLVVPALAYADVSDAAERAAEKAIPGKKRVLGFFPPQLFLDDGDLDAVGQKKLHKAIEAAVEALPGIAQVYVMDEPDEDHFASLMRASAPLGRSAPLFVRTAPRVVMLEEKGQNGTDHGTPYLYDRRVPFVVVGAGVRRGRFAQPVDSRDVAPTLAFLLGVSPPDGCQGRPVSAVGDR